jgi:hypothetical protein
MRPMIVAGMLVPALSASLTPANAGPFTPYCGARINGAAGYQMCGHCIQQCYGGQSPLAAIYLENLRRCKPGAACDLLVIPTDISVCMATCVNAKRAARR